MLDKTARICCIGFQKTGTTSIAEALRRLGYTSRNIHKEVNARLLAEPDADPQKLSEDIAIDVLRSVHVIEDSPTPFIYEALDRAYPGSKFILTTRPVEKWLASYQRFFPDENNPLRRWMYGTDRLSGHEDHYRAIYETRHAELRAYFADRPGDFLEMDLSTGAGWYELVNFLGKDALPPFPHSNAGGTLKQKRRYGTGMRRLFRKLAG
jgi:hypothetical protein